MAPVDRPRWSRGTRAQAETIGVVLILAMTLIGATVALAVGTTALNDFRVDAQEGGIEHAMTQLDSRTAMVALGDSPNQRVPLASTGRGAYSVDPSAGWIRVKHHNFTDSGNDNVIYNETLGALIYENDRKSIGYQGGGVWFKEGEGSRMISPPEFHYRGATLTLPVIRMQNRANAAGSGVTAKINAVGRTNRFYPNQSRNYTGGSRLNVNPIREGEVIVTIQSEYYQAWAEYFRSRSDGEVTVNHANKTASLELITIGIVGDFQMPAEGNALEIRGFGPDHPVTNFTVVLRPDDSDSADFANLQWTLYADEGGHEVEIHLRAGTSNSEFSTHDCTARNISATIYYSDTNGDPYHGWKNDSAFVTKCEDLNGDGDNESILRANFSGNAILTMQELSSDDVIHFNPSGDEFKDPVIFDEHDGVDWEDPSKTFSTTGDDTTTIGNLTNHYLAFFGRNVDLFVDDKNSDTVNEEASRGTFTQTGSGASITFLHITENDVRIEFE